MTFEEQLIKKSYFETYMESGNRTHPVRALGELYLEEQKKDMPDLSYIRFAQGEVYFHNKDYEAAIFKWENITNELEPWAKKNMGDAFLELGLLNSAEELYLSIETESDVLKIESGLQLLSLYIEQGKLDKAVAVIKKFVALDPDYPGVTEIARAFFEEHNDWENAVELAVSEGVRTGSPKWFDVLNQYVDHGHTTVFGPEYFNEALSVLYQVDRSRFEQLAVSLWLSYKGRTNYMAWLKDFNQLFSGMDGNRRDGWTQLSGVYQDAYFELINGDRLIKEISPLIPDLLTNWLKITSPANSLVSASSIIAWNEVFPGSITASAIKDAETLILNSREYHDGYEDSMQLFQMIIKWAEEHEIEVGNRIKWMVQGLNESNVHNLLIAGVSGNGKSSFVNSIVGEELITVPTAAVIRFKNQENPEIHEITDTDVRQITDLEDFKEAAGVSRKTHKHETIIDFKAQFPFIGDHGLALIDTPGVNRNNYDKHPLYNYLRFADSLLFVLNANDPFTEKEREILSNISEYFPNLPIHFLLNKMDVIYSQQEAIEIFDQTWSEISQYYPDAKMFAFSSNYDQAQQLKDFSDFIKSNKRAVDLEQERTSKLQFFVRRAITYLLDKRIEIENNHMESISWNEEMVGKLNGAINQLGDIEEEKSRSIQKSFRKIKDDTRAEIIEKIPGLLRNCSELVTEESDFGRIHEQMDEEMNKRIQEYLDTSVLPKFHDSLEGWIDFSKNEFDQSQNYLNEMAEGFNSMYGEERISLECDFRVLDDWRRDANRMTSGVHYEKVNIMNRSTPQQFFLKSAGKLLGVLPQNNAMLYNRYKTYLETEDYYEIGVSIAKKFLQQFEIFEKSIDRDVNLFFKQPFIELEGAVDHARSEIEYGKNELEKMRINPELYRDPLTLYEVKLRQYEWMTAAGRGE
ncbi:dynamin family protein [Mesobacillus subterraneus]|uniref:GTP-binding protein n=1 Tax=Mesobacillus subterraneus TaxID=285983 RepID=A0A427THZ3_9BACI|nr:dynamin family protein [Mesobacillus subterraneus]RSD23265.1 GTP-binding protein [Mesobacillus subterraneus]